MRLNAPESNLGRFLPEKICTYLSVQILGYASDRYDKKELYERCGVREYWLVDPQNQSIEVFSYENNRYQLHSFADAEGEASSAVLPGFKVESKAIFGTGETEKK